jgi:hypothetical protein
VDKQPLIASYTKEKLDYADYTDQFCYHKSICVK